MRHHSQIRLRYICQSEAYHWSGDSWGITYACSWFALPRRSWVSVGTVSESLEDAIGGRGKASAKTDTWRGGTKQNRRHCESPGKWFLFKSSYKIHLPTLNFFWIVLSSLKRRVRTCCDSLTSPLRRWQIHYDHDQKEVWTARRACLSQTQIFTGSLRRLVVGLSTPSMSSAGSQPRRSQRCPRSSNWRHAGQDGRDAGLCSCAY